jgi:N-glycosylase/DNA lyase
MVLRPLRVLVPVQVPIPFDLDLVVRSHGWYDLAPWRYEQERRLLGRPFLVGERAAWVEVAPDREKATGLAIRIEGEGRWAASALRQAKEAMRGCLELDLDLAPFYRRIEEVTGGRPSKPALPPLAWARSRGAGRLLRSPTVFEDAVKTLCTTNCSWALTRVMVSQLVERLGSPAPRASRAFPTPEAMAERPERFYREKIRAGYRAPHLRWIARAVARGELDIEAWLHSALPTDELYQRILQLPGFGSYAAEHLLKLLGRFDHLALDSWSRGKVARVMGRRRPATDLAVRKWFRPFGEYAGLAFWLTVTADWHGKAPSWPEQPAG